VREYFIRPMSSPDSGCRGGVKNKDHDGYEVEIGPTLHCSDKMLSLMIHYGEIMEVLEKSDSLVCKLLLRSIERERGDIKTYLSLCDKNKKREEETQKWEEEMREDNRKALRKLSEKRKANNG